MDKPVTIDVAPAAFQDLERLEGFLVDSDDPMAVFCYRSSWKLWPFWPCSRVSAVPWKGSSANSSSFVGADTWHVTTTCVTLAM